MAFTFLHTGDWHIGKPFGRFGEDEAGVLRRARLQAIDRLALAARAAGATTALVAGDLYDRPDLADRDMHEPMARMRNYAEIAWHIIPGNHDPATEGGIWERVTREGLPGNVKVHIAPKPLEMAAGVWLLPAPLATKATSRDPTAYMCEAATPPGAIRIGLAHGSVQGFGSDGEASVTIAPDRDRTAGLSYLALGDWHGLNRIGARVWYAGTPEPEGYLDNAPGHALIVRVEAAEGPIAVEAVDIGQFRWLSRNIEAARSTDLVAVEREIAELGPAAHQVLLEIRASGRLTLTEDRALDGRLNALAPQVFHLSRRLESLQLVAKVEDLDRLGDGGLRDLAQSLSELAANELDPQSAVAERALRRLFDLAEQAT